MKFGLKLIIPLAIVVAYALTIGLLIPGFLDELIALVAAYFVTKSMGMA